MIQGSASDLTSNLTSNLSMKLFGAFEARWNGILMTGLQVRDAERILVLLTLNQGRALQSASLASILWPETGSLDSLRQSVAYLRSLLGEESARLQTSKGSITLDLDGANVDVLAFDQAVADNDTDRLKQALALSRSPLLQGREERHPEDRQWVADAREKRRQERKEALKTLARACLAQEDHEPAAGYLQQYVSASPGEEWAWTHWMQALAATGERIAAIIVTDLQRLSSQHWDSPDSFLLALARSIAEQLDLPVAPENVWRAGEGPNENFERYLKREVLKKVSAPVVWGLDEVDRLFAYAFRNDIFGLFRSWYNDRALNPASPWHRLTLAIVYATEAHLFITDLNHSPFNVGTRLTLEDFTIESVGELNRKCNGPLNDRDKLIRFMLLVGGNPYLVRRGLYEFTTRQLSLEAFEAQADRDEGCYGDHLQRLLQSLSRDRRLCNAVLDLLQGKHCPSLDSFYRLRSAGVITGSELETARFRCPIYTTYLGAHLR